MSPEHPPTVLVVEPESDTSRSLVARLRADGFHVVSARDGEAAYNVLDATRVDALVAPARRPRVDGLALMHHALERHPDACVVLVMDGADADAAAEAIRRGAADAPPAPLHPDRLLAVLRRGLVHQRRAARVAALEERLDERFGLERIAGTSRAIRRVVDQVRQVAATRAPVLLEGEPGTGRRLVAQAIHQHSPRRDQPFVSLSCEAVPEPVLESDLFGHEPPRGAGTPGGLERADGGTLYLTDIEALPAALQVRLSRVLRERAFERAGGRTTLRADVRVIVSGSRPLAAEVRAGRFREDLQQRLGMVRVQMPPLRERREDIPLLVERFIREAGRAHHRRVTGISRGALERMMAHDWPGNVRELRDTIDRMVETARGRRALSLSDLPDELRPESGGGARIDVAVGMTAEEAERHLILATLEHAGGDKVRAAAMLGIGLRTLYRKLDRYAPAEPPGPVRRGRPGRRKRG